MTDNIVLSPNNLIRQGAEARIYLADYQGQPVVVKERFSKQYRHPDLDKKLTRQRMKTVGFE